MKHLILMRHANAVPGDDDRARPLTPDGFAEAERMGRALGGLAARGFAPVHALVSPARRARETLAAVERALGALEAAEDEALYLASAGRLLSRLQRLDASAMQVLVIGHNPGLADLVRELVGRSDPAARARAARGLAPGACAALRVAAAAWSELAPGCAELVAFLRPGD